MQLFSSYSEVPANLAPVVLTIGNFDAVHRGHSGLLHEAKKVAEKIDGHLIVLTFSNHPLEVLRPEKKLLKVCTLKHKLALLGSKRVDGTLLLEFSIPFSRQTAREFLYSLHRHFTFGALVLGHDARIGSDRLGDSAQMHHLAKKLQFNLQYVAALNFGEQRISSSLIRRAIAQGDFTLVESMLGREYSILTEATQVAPDKITLTGLEGLCLPPIGVYTVQVFLEGRNFPAIAEIQTFDSTPAIDVRFLEPYAFDVRSVEVVFASKR